MILASERARNLERTTLTPEEYAVIRDILADDIKALADLLSVDLGPWLVGPERAEG